MELSLVYQKICTLLISVLGKFYGLHLFIQKTYTLFILVLENFVRCISQFQKTYALFILVLKTYTLFILVLENLTLFILVLESVYALYLRLRNLNALHLCICSIYIHSSYQLQKTYILFILVLEKLLAEGSMGSIFLVYNENQKTQVLFLKSPMDMRHSNGAM